MSGGARRGRSGTRERCYDAGDIVIADITSDEKISLEPTTNFVTEQIP